MTSERSLAMGHLLDMSCDGKLHDPDQRCPRLVVSTTLLYHSYADLTFTVPPNPHSSLRWRPVPNDAQDALNHDFNTCLPQTEERIRAVTTIKEVMALQTELGGHVDSVTFSRRSFEALLANQAMFHSIHSFLRNPAVNVAEASNFATFFAHPLAANISPEAYDILVDTLQSAIRVGCVLHSEIGAIVRSVKELVRNIFRLSPLQDRQNKLLEAYQAIWEGLKACRVTTIRSTVALQLLDEMTLLRALPESKSLRLELCRYAWPVRQMQESVLAEWAHLARLGSLDAYPNIPTQIDRATLIDVLDSLPSENRLRSIISTTRHIAERCTEATDDSREWKDTLIFWLGCLQRLESFEQKFSCHRSVLHSSPDKENRYPVRLTAGWHEVYCLLSARLPATELSDHFKLLPAPETCRILLKFWIPHLFNRADAPAGNQLCEHSAYPRLIAQDVNAAFEKKVSERPYSSEVLKSLSFSAILFALSRSFPSCHRSAELILDLVFKMYGPNVLLNVLKRCIKFQLPFPRRPLVEIIESLSEDQPRLAYYIWRCCGIEVSHFPRLLISLIQSSCVHSAEIFRMLRYNGPANTEPMNKPLVRYVPLLQSRNHLLHLIALAFANSRSKKNRVVYRNVEFCYWYLVEHHTRLQPAMTRALVHAGITRPLQNYQHINLGRCRWILRIVRAVEGDEVADQLDTVIRHWRANVRRSLPSGPRIMNKRQRKWVRRERSGVPVATCLTDLSKEINQVAAIVKRTREMEKRAERIGLMRGGVSKMTV